MSWDWPVRAHKISPFHALAFAKLRLEQQKFKLVSVVATSLFLCDNHTQWENKPFWGAVE
jgi:hypothetical protein